MPSRNAVGIAPLVCGLLLVGQSLPELLDGASATLSTYALAAQAIGGSAAVVVGVGILREWESFGGERTEEETHSASVLLGVVAMLAFAVGVVAVVFV